MSNSALYVFTVLIWGTTWIAIKFQLGEVASLVSIAHRFFLAALLIFFYLIVRRQLVTISRRDHCFVFLQGMSLFCINYVFIYTATATLASGLVAVVFSTMLILNMVNGAIFFGAPIQRTVVLGALIGLLGMVGVFLPELQALSLTDDNFRALLMCLGGTVFASFGNMFSLRNLRRGLPVLTCNAWGMAYGAVTLYVVAIVSGQAITIEMTAPYLLSLFYLALFGSVLAFWAYLTLIGNIGMDKAAYTSLVFPVVALLISTVLEGYSWSVSAIFGMSLVVLGNWLVMHRAKA
ncbi:MAG: drug/metabolite transporter (DMT)-like permease [Halioglobus sp.]